MTTISLIINIFVLVPVCVGLVTDASWTQEAYGTKTPARSILLSIYLAILLASIVFLWMQDPKMIFTLLSLQIIYKVTTPFTVGTLNNPEVVSNLLIAAFHIVTVYTLWKAGFTD